MLKSDSGNVVAGYDSATNAVFTADYKPYGEFAATTGNVAGRRFMWVGSWGYRFTSGVPVSHYVRARHLSMRMGMWTSVDPLWPSEPAFGYVRGRVLAGIDYHGTQLIQAVPPFNPIRPMPPLRIVPGGRPAPFPGMGGNRPTFPPVTSPSGQQFEEPITPVGEPHPEDLPSFPKPDCSKRYCSDLHDKYKEYCGGPGYGPRPSCRHIKQRLRQRPTPALIDEMFKTLTRACKCCEGRKVAYLYCFRDAGHLQVMNEQCRACRNCMNLFDELGYQGPHWGGYWARPRPKIPAPPPWLPPWLWTPDDPWHPSNFTA